MFKVGSSIRVQFFTATLFLLTACGGSGELLDEDQFARDTEDQSTEGTDNQPDEGTDNQPEEATGDQPDEGTDNPPEEETGDQPDEGTDNQPEDGTGDQPDEGTDNQPEEETGGQPDEGTDNQPEEETGDPPDEGTDDSPEEEIVDQPDEGTDNQPEEETDNQPDEGSGDDATEDDIDTDTEAAGPDLFLILGQSNSAGRDTNFDPTGADLPSSDVLLFTDGNSFETATQPLNRFSGVRNTNIDQGVNLGLEFGKAMNLDNGRQVYLVANSRGGSKVAEWREGRDSGYFENTIQRVKDAEAACSCELTGILWHQGEGNVSSDGTFTNSYFNSLVGLIGEYRAELGNVPFVVGQLFDVEKNDSFNDALRQVDDADFGASDVDWVSSENLTTFDGTHFDAASIRLFGDRYAAIMQQFVN